MSAKPQIKIHINAHVDFVVMYKYIHSYEHCKHTLHTKSRYAPITSWLRMHYVLLISMPSLQSTEL